MTLNRKSYYKYDFIVLIIISFICVSVFGHRDVLTTAQHSLAYLQQNTSGIKGFVRNLAQFYVNAKNYSGDTGINYMPSTFVMFAIWNLPLKILGTGLPELSGDYSIPFIMWNKMLPVLMFCFSCILLYFICKRDLELNEDKSMIAVLAFASSGISFFSQFFFCQYDIFTVFFMLLGIHFYFANWGERRKRDYLFFLLSFAAATSFKYYAILILIVLIILNEKNVIKIVAQTIMGCSVILFEGVGYLMVDRVNFTEQVLKFGVLTYTQMSSISAGLASINLVPFLCCIFFLILYRIHPKDKDEYIQYFIWGGCLICLVLFGFMGWNPQWLLFAVPFWTLAMIYNQDRETLIYLDIVMSVTFVGYVVHNWINNVDQDLFRYGIFMDLFRYRKYLPQSDTMSRFFPLNPNLLYTIFVATIVGYCIWSYPRGKQGNCEIDVKKCVPLLRIRFLVGIAVFVIPAVLCIPDMLKQDEFAWGGWNTAPEYRYATDYLMEEEDVVIQKLTGIEGRISELDVYTVVPGNNTEGMILSVEIIDEDTMQVIAYGETQNYINNCNYTHINFASGDVLEYNKNYLIAFHSNVEAGIQLAVVEYQDGNVVIDKMAKKREHKLDQVFHNNEWLEQATLQMNIYTRANNDAY